MILYIHIPFCTSKCGYCTFNSYEDQESLIPAYVQALKVDITHTLNQNFESIQSIFFGGGTPNTINSRLYEEIFESIIKNSSLEKDCEITTEANLELINKHWCKDLKSLGINRISLGVQSFFEDKLAFLQRQHNGRDISQAIHQIYESGIENISIDLIYDTPQDNKKRIFQEIKRAAQLPINHLSAYSLSIENGSKLAQTIDKENYPDYSFFEEVREVAKFYNFLPYEVSSYARNYRVKHNLSYWNGNEYIGCGAGSVGRIGKKRLYTHSNLTHYIKNPLYRRVEMLNEKDIRLENIFLGLRCELGADIKLFNPKKLQILIEENKCYIKNNRVLAKDFFLADEIALWVM